MQAAPFFPAPDPATFSWQSGPATAFSNLTSAELGNMGTSSDGFDSAFAAVLSAFDSTQALNDAADASLLAVADPASAFSEDGIDQLAGTVSADTPTLDNLNTALQDSVQQYAQPPTLPQIPADVSLPDFQIPDGIITPSFGPNAPVTGSTIYNDLKTVLEGIGVAGKALLGLLEQTLLAIPVYGWIIAGIGVIIGLLWHGADPNQVPAAMTEQVFELAADGFHRLFLQHFLSLDQVGSLYASLIAEGAAREQALEQQYGEVKPFAAGILNMTRTINALYLQDRAVPDIGTTPLQLIFAETTWDAMPKGGFYPQSVQQAHDIYFAAINAILGRK